MKGNRKIRLTVIMVALALVTSVFAVGTLSKYSIGGGAGDDARVAKWGVTIDIEGQNSFATESSNGAIVSSNSDKVVAPGTDSTESDGLMAVTLKGTPEVDFQLTINLGTTQDVFLKAGTYPDFTKATVDGARDNFTQANDYYPVVFTFTHYYNGYSLEGCVNPGIAGTTDSGVTKVLTTVPTITGYANAEAFTGTLAQMDAFFENISKVMEKVEANYELDDRFELTWAWEFGDSANNPADTMLGNLAADPALYGALPAGTYNLNLAYTFSISIEQLD